MAKREKKLMRRRLAGAWLSSVVSISLVLFLVGIACLLLLNAGGVSDYFKENMKVSVLMKPDAGEGDISRLRSRLESMPFIRDVEFVSSEQGMREMTKMLGEDFLGAFDVSPVPASFDITLEASYFSADSLDMVGARLRDCPGVDEVSYQKSMVDTLNENLSRISLWLGVFILLMLFISFVLINNTVRLNVYAKRFTVHTMNLVGATRGFIRRPFLGRAVIQGLVSAAVALLMLGGLLLVIRDGFPQILEIFGRRVLLLAAAAVVVTGVTICVVSTYFVVGKLASMGKDELYY